MLAGLNCPKGLPENVRYTVSDDQSFEYLMFSTVIVTLLDAGFGSIQSRKLTLVRRAGSSTLSSVASERQTQYSRPGVFSCLCSCVSDRTFTNSIYHCIPWPATRLTIIVAISPNSLNSIFTADNYL